MNTQFSAVDTVLYSAHVQREDERAASAARASEAESPASAIRRLRGAELALLAARARAHASRPDLFSDTKARLDSDSKPLMRPALAWAMQCATAALLLVALLAAVAVWSDSRNQSADAPAVAHSASALQLQPSTSTFALHLPVFHVTSVRREVALQMEPAAAELHLSPEEQAQVQAHAWLQQQHQRDREIAAEAAAAAAVGKSPAPGGPLDAFAASARAAQRRLLCDKLMAPHSFPSAGVFTAEELRDGAIVLHLLFLVYLMLGWSVLWTDYVAPLARHIGQTFGLHTNKGEATMLALVGCLPNLCMSLFSVFLTRRDFGTGAVLGSSIMNTFVIPALIFFFLPHIAFPVYWWRAARDLVCLSASVLIMVACTITGQQISLVECIVLFLVLFAYCYVLTKDSALHVALGRALYAAKKKKAREKRLGKKQSRLQRVLEHSAFSGFITLCIVVSIVFVVWDSVGEQLWLVNANYAISAIFLLEAVLKHFAYGTLNYWSDPLNAFDGVLVVLILFELIFGNGAIATSVRAVRLFRFLRALRGLRAVRVYRNTALAQNLADRFRRMQSTMMLDDDPTAAAAAEADAADAAAAAAANGEIPPDSEGLEGGDGGVGGADDPRASEPSVSVADAVTHQPIVLVDSSGRPILLGPRSNAVDASGKPLLHTDGTPVRAFELPIEAGSHLADEEKLQSARRVHAAMSRPGSAAAKSRKGGAADTDADNGADNGVGSGGDGGGGGGGGGCGGMESQRNSARSLKSRSRRNSGAQVLAAEQPHISTLIAVDGRVVAGDPAPSAAGAYINMSLLKQTVEAPGGALPPVLVVQPDGTAVLEPSVAGNDRSREVSRSRSALSAAPAARQLTGAQAVAHSASIALPPSPVHSQFPSVRLPHARRGSHQLSRLGDDLNVRFGNGGTSHRAQMGLSSQLGVPSVNSLTAGSAAGSTPSLSVRVLVREGVIDEETGEATAELVVIQGNAGATEEELALLAEEDDDDDDDDDDLFEEEEDEEDHWTEMLAEADGRGPKGEVGEPVLDVRGEPTGLIKVFVRGVEPRRWSALGPKWNPHRETIGFAMVAMMSGMALLIIAVNIKNQIAGTAV